MSKKNFFKRLQNSPKIKAIRKKRRAHDLKGKKLGAEYRRALKSEAKRLK